ncbi:flavin-containing amine oxidoreductase-domain containing protein [Globomyces pollinis-pini]|nr:flavin-containing amine oxidoreductase-domain containing protein [Globomyces pollinis-pini]
MTITNSSPDVDQSILSSFMIPVDALSIIEIEYFPNLALISDYILARNSFITIWHRYFKNQLTSFSIIKSKALTIPSLSVNELDEQTTITAFNFLDRFRFINYGVLKSVIPHSIDQTKSVIIIGGGLSGLTAARELVNIYQNQPGAQIPRIIILEGRQRIGGRVFTFPLHSKWNDTTSVVDFGPSYIGKEPHTDLMLQQLQIEVKDVPSIYDSKSLIIYDSDGYRVDHESLDAAKNLADEIFAELYSKIETLLSDINKRRSNDKRSFDMMGKSDKETIGLPSVGKLLDNIIQQNPVFGKLRAEHIRLLNWHIGMLEFKLRAPLNSLSIESPTLLSLLKPKTPQMFVPGGFSQLTHALAYGIDENGLSPIDIRCAHRVESIQLKQNSIEVTHSRGIIEGSVAIFAVPLSSLTEENIKFIPRLPSRKSIAMNQLAMGVVNKICLVFPRIFWPLHTEKFGLLSSPNEKESLFSSRGKFFLVENMYSSTQLPCLVVYTSGLAAETLEKQPDSSIINKIMMRLAMVFPNEQPLPLPIESVVTRWSSDIFSRGSSVYLKAGGNPDAFRDLRLDSKRLCWAGEQMSLNKPGTVEGAILSGRDAARRAADELLGYVHYQKQSS